MVANFRETVKLPNSLSYVRTYDAITAGWTVNKLGFMDFQNTCGILEVHRGCVYPIAITILLTNANLTDVLFKNGYDEKSV